MKKILILICILLLTGCGQWIQIRADSVPTREKYIVDRLYYEKNYKIGETITAFVGQEIIRVRPFNEKTAIYTSVKKTMRSQTSLFVDAQYRWSKYHIKSEANKEYSINKSIQVGNQSGRIAQTGIQKFNILQLNDDDGNEWGILISDSGVVFNAAIYSLSHGMLFYPSSISVSPAIFEISENREKAIEDGKLESITPGPFSELIYSGKNDVSLNFTYREYTPDNLARPAFFQNLTYQASAKQIRFKDFVIKIDDVSNEKITYTVLEDGLK